MDDQQGQIIIITVVVEGVKGQLFIVEHSEFETAGAAAVENRMTMPPCKGRSLQKWFVEISLDELAWFAQSPDLNPIKHLWDELERRL
jgi:hypothetical protein